MRKPKSSTGSAYVMILIVMLTLFLLLTAALGVTAVGRRVSGQYMRFAGLYNLALAGNERALFLLEAERALLAEADIEADAALLWTGFAQTQLQNDGGWRYFYYRLGTATGEYYVRTRLRLEGHRFRVVTEARKNDGPPTRVYAWIGLSGGVMEMTGLQQIAH